MCFHLFLFNTLTGMDLLLPLFNLLHLTFTRACFRRFPLTVSVLLLQLKTILAVFFLQLIIVHVLHTVNNSSRFTYS